MKLGENVYISASARIDDLCHLISIGDDVIIADGVTILAHDSSANRQVGCTTVRARVVIGSRTFIGANSIILPGVTVGNNVVIGAGSVVTQNVPSGVVVAGNPARVVRTTNDLVKKRISTQKT